MGKTDTDAATAYRVDETRRGFLRGWHYTPLRQGKRPYLPGWPDRRDSADQACQWAARGNVGLICGEASGITAVDLDGAAADRLDEFPATPTVRTGGDGYHLYYLTPAEGTVKNWVGKLGEHIDLRTTGGQVVAVGSIHPDTGKQYVWADGLSPDEVDFAPFPLELVQKLHDEQQARHAEAQRIRREAAAAVATANTDTPVPPRPSGAAEARRISAWAAAALKTEAAAVAAAPEGSGNASINTAAFNLGQLVGGGYLAESDVIAGLRDATAHWQAHNGNDGAMRSAIESTIASGLRAGKASPRRAPAPREPRQASEYAGPTPDENGEIVEDYGQGEVEPVREVAAAGSRGTAPAAPRTIDAHSVTVTGEATPLGEKNEHGRVVLSPRRTLPTAHALLRDEFHDAEERHPHIAFYNGSFYRWTTRQNCWRELDPVILRRQVGRYLNTAVRYHTAPNGDKSFLPFESNPRTISDAIDSLKSECSIDRETPVPAWLAGDAPRPVLELVPFKSRTVHLPTGEEYPPNPQHWALNALEFDYNPDAAEPAEWLAFLDTFLDGDAEQIALLQEWFGHCLLPDPRHHKIMLLVGPPRAGKGITSRVLSSLIGASNICNPSVGELAEQFGLSAWVGKSLAIFGDADWNTRDAAAAVEKLLRVSGGDAVNIRRMHLPSLTNVKLHTRVMICANDTPTFANASGAMANRFLAVRSLVSHLGREDLGLEGRLMGELPGILLWAIRGWERLRAQGRFTRPQATEEEIESMKAESAPVARFVTECCEMYPEDETARLSPAAMYAAWCRWCNEVGSDRPGSDVRFFRQFRSAFPRVGIVKPHGLPRYYAGIVLKAEYDQQAPEGMW